MNNRTLRLATLDIFSCFASLYISFLIRFDFQIPEYHLQTLLSWLPWFGIIQIAVFYISGLYARIWRYTNLLDLYAILSSVCTSWGISTIYIILIMGSKGYPRSVLLLYLILNSLAAIAIRLCARIYYTHYHNNSILKNKEPKKRLLLVGAGRTGEKISREIRTTFRNQYNIIGFADDNHMSHGGLLNGKEILCSVSEIPNLKIKYDEILITAPSANGEQMRKIVKICKESGKRYKTVPGINEIIGGEISMAVVRDVNYSDLLGREEVHLDNDSIKSILKGKRVLITGAGGSIGSELVKQCLSFSPSEIICLDLNEEAIYKIDQYFSNLQSKTVLKTVLASINDINECDKIFSENRPHIVFHAAAYKHVPIQELHPWAAIKTNIGGTLNIVRLSDKYKIDKFVLVSTDKAVNPVNVMGATKRASEKLIQIFNNISKTTYMAVRFGNVLGSSGSAIPTFQEQIKQGGPITITHPEMTRYFMSIQEASQLILQCGAYGRDGEIFLLEMGKPIRILQMAKDLIRLSGLEPGVDIPIVFTGLRPGEKLYEELQLFNERKVYTSHKKIMILKDSKAEVSWDMFKINIDELLDAAQNLDSEKIQILLKQVLPTYSPRTFNSLLENSGSYQKVPKIKAEA